MQNRFALFFLFLTLPFSNCIAQKYLKSGDSVIVGAARMSEYLPLLKGKSVGVVMNQTSMVGNALLVDTLLHSGVNVKKIFSPEHGFRGSADAGENISNTTDSKTGLPVISLYGDQKKPTAEMLKDVDLLIYDIQDVGVRFYTYVSTLHLLMESCVENNKSLIVLDRPDPNGWYVDGPVLQREFSSFVGMDPVPIVYGMTPGEYALMLNGEGWLTNGLKCELKIISCKNYDHQTLYKLPVNPSPNLRNMNAIYLYPSLCLFEGTVVSVGRGTNKPFEYIGYPDCTKGNTKFTPVSLPGATNPPYRNVECNGLDLSVFNVGFFEENHSIMLSWLINMYRDYPDPEKFFTSYFDNLAGIDSLRKQIIAGTPEQLIRNSWQPALDEFKIIRKKYLLYSDFE